MTTIGRLQREAREQAAPSVHIRNFDKIDSEIQEALAEMVKVAAQAMREGKLGRPSPRYDDVYFEGMQTLAEDETTEGNTPITHNTGLAGSWEFSRGQWRFTEDTTL